MMWLILTSKFTTPPRKRRPVIIKVSELYEFFQPCQDLCFCLFKATAVKEFLNRMAKLLQCDGAFKHVVVTSGVARDVD